MRVGEKYKCGRMVCDITFFFTINNKRIALLTFFSIFSHSGKFSHIFNVFVALSASRTKAEKARQTAFYHTRTSRTKWFSSSGAS